MIVITVFGLTILLALIFIIRVFAVIPFVVYPRQGVRLNYIEAPVIDVYVESKVSSQLHNSDHFNLKQVYNENDYLLVKKLNDNGLITRGTINSEMSTRDNYGLPPVDRYFSKISVVQKPY